MLGPPGLVGFVVGVVVPVVARCVLCILWVVEAIVVGVVKCRALLFAFSRFDGDTGGWIGGVAPLAGVGCGTYHLWHSICVGVGLKVVWV